MIFSGVYLSHFEIKHDSNFTQRCTKQLVKYQLLIFILPSSYFYYFLQNVILRYFRRRGIICFQESMRYLFLFYSQVKLKRICLNYYFGMFEIKNVNIRRVLCEMNMMPATCWLDVSNKIDLTKEIIFEMGIQYRPLK